MGKLILGIIAVVLLQFAFFIYMARDGRMDTNASVARTISPEPSTPPTPVSESIPVAPSTPVDVDPPHPKKKSSVATDRARVNVGQRLRDRDPIRRGPEAEPAVVRLRSRKPAPPEYSFHRTAALVPRGHTMVLVDCAPVRPRPEERQIMKPAKRSYLARTFTPLVKKPWKWMKSLASKLD